MQERQGHALRYRPGLPAEFRRTTHALSVVQEKATTASTAMAAKSGYIVAVSPDYRYAWCRGIALPIDGRPQSEVQVAPDKLPSAT